MRLTVVALLAASLLAGCGEAPPAEPLAGITVPARTADPSADPSTSSPSASASPSTPGATAAPPSPSTTRPPSGPSPSSEPTQPPARPSTSRPPSAPSRPVPRTVEDPLAELDVEDQRGDGGSVTVAEAVLSRGSGWVVVRSSSGRILGTAPVRQGTRLLRVVLDRPATTGVLRAELRKDDGDGRFRASTDLVVTEDGERVSESFEYVLE